MSSNPPYIITIDGTSSSGKSTISRLLAKKLNFKLLDSGKLSGFILYVVECTLVENGELSGIDVVSSRTYITRKWWFILYDIKQTLVENGELSGVDVTHKLHHSIIYHTIPNYILL